MLELTCQEVDLEVVRVGDVAVLRAVSDAYLIINIPLSFFMLEEVISKLSAVMPIAA